MLKMMTMNPCDAFVHAQYGKMLKPRSLIRKVKGVDKHIERFRINVQKSQLQDCQTFQNWWQFYANRSKPVSFLKLQRQRTANRGFLDQIKDEKAANFLKILHKHETSDLLNIFDPWVKELEKCFKCSCKQKKRRLPRKRAKPKLFKTSYTKPEAPQDLAKETSSIKYKEPKPMERIPKSILRKQSILPESTNESPNQIISETSSKKEDEKSERKSSENTEKKVDESSEKKSIKKVVERSEKKPNEKADERSEIKWNEKKWKKVLEKSLGKKLSEDFNNRSETSLNESLDERPEKKSVEKTIVRRMTGKRKTIAKLDDTTDKKRTEPLEHLMNTISSYQRIHKILNGNWYKRPSKLIDGQLENKLDIQESKIIEKSDEELVKSDEYTDEKLRKSRDFSSVTDKEIAKLEKLLGRKSTRRKRKLYSFYNMKSSKSVKSLNLHDQSPFPLGRRVMGRFSNSSKQSESRSTLSYSKNIRRSELQKFSTPRKPLDSEISAKLGSINSQQLKSTRSDDTLLRRQSNSTPVDLISQKSENILMPEDLIPTNSENILTTEEFIPGISEVEDVQPEDSKAKTHSIISSTSSIFWRMMSLEQHSASSIEREKLQKYPPMDIEKHINAFMETLNFDKFKYENLPKNWPKSFESSLVKRFRQQHRKTFKMKNTLTNHDDTKYRKTKQKKSSKKTDGRRGSKRKFLKKVSKNSSDLHSSSSCEICCNFHNIEPDPPYMAEMKKLQKQNDLKNYYKARLIPRKPTKTLPNVKSLDDLAKKLERTPSIREKLIICYQMLSDCRNIVDSRLKLKQSNERSL